MSESVVNNPIDHIVWAVPELATGMEQIRELTGITPVYGGRHLQFGTHNALLSLGERCYFEIIAPDPDNKEVPAPRWMGVDLIDTGQITRWALGTSQLSANAQHLSAVNKGLARTTEGQRLTASGDLLKWQLSVPQPAPLCETIPFLIDWQDSRHPAEGLNASCHIINFSIIDPKAKVLRHLLEKLRSDIAVEEGPVPKLKLELQTPLGRVTIS